MYHWEDNIEITNYGLIYNFLVPLALDFFPPISRNLLMPAAIVKGCVNWLPSSLGVSKGHGKDQNQPPGDGMERAPSEHMFQSR